MHFALTHLLLFKIFTKQISKIPKCTYFIRALMVGLGLFALGVVMPEEQAQSCSLQLYACT